MCRQPTVQVVCGLSFHSKRVIRPKPCDVGQNPDKTGRAEEILAETGKAGLGYGHRPLLLLAK